MKPIGSLTDSVTTGLRVEKSGKTGTSVSTSGSNQISLAELCGSAVRGSVVEIHKAHRALLKEPSISPDDLKALEVLIQPIRPMDLAQKLSKLQALTKRREGADEDLLIAAYMEKLTPYPSDIIEYVFDQWAQDNTFFPSWHELYENLHFWVESRRETYNLLAGVVPGGRGKKEMQDCLMRTEIKASTDRAKKYDFNLNDFLNPIAEKYGKTLAEVAEIAKKMEESQ